MEFFKQLFSSDFMPLEFCNLSDPRVAWWQVAWDGLITLVPLVPKVFSLPEWIL